MDYPLLFAWRGSENPTDQEVVDFWNKCLESSWAEVSAVVPFLNKDDFPLNKGSSLTRVGKVKITLDGVELVSIQCPAIPAVERIDGLIPEVTLCMNSRPNAPRDLPRVKHLFRPREFSPIVYLILCVIGLMFTSHIFFR